MFFHLWHVNIAKSFLEEINCDVRETCKVTKRNVRNVVDNPKTSHDELRRNKFGQATIYSMFIAWWKPFSNRIGETRRLHPFIGLETNNEIIARVENVLYVYGCSTNRGDSVDSVLFALLNAAIFLLIPRPIPWDPPLRVPCTPSENSFAINWAVCALSTTASFYALNLRFRSYPKAKVFVAMAGVV